MCNVLWICYHRKLVHFVFSGIIDSNIITLNQFGMEGLLYKYYVLKKKHRNSDSCTCSNKPAFDSISSTCTHHLLKNMESKSKIGPELGITNNLSVIITANYLYDRVEEEIFLLDKGIKTLEEFKKEKPSVLHNTVRHVLKKLDVWQ